MHATSVFVAASSLLTFALAAPIPASSLAERAFSYINYGGDGSTTKGWPSEASWKTFDALWAANEPVLKISCSQFGVANNSPQEIAAIKAAILAGAERTKISAQFILAAMMQESKGCVRAPTTNYGQENPGLMQSFNGKFSCNSAAGVINPCPAENIQGQIAEGLGETTAFGYIQAIQQSKSEGVAKYYKAARIYNSGSVAASGNLGDGIATHCYSSDIANRLKGWTTESSQCQEASIGSFQGSIGGTEQGNAETEGNGTGNTQTPTPAPTPTPTPAPSTGNTNGNTNTNNNGETEPTAPKAAGASSNCKSWYTVKAGDTCESTGQESALRSLNQIDANCGNLWLGYAYCIAQ